MHKRIVGVAVAVAIVIGVSGCNPVGEPWDSTGYFEQEREGSEDLRRRLQHRLMHTQIDTQRAAHHTGGS